MLLLGLLLLMATGTFTLLLVAENRSGTPEYTVTMFDQDIGTMDSLGIFLAGIALALFFALSFWMTLVGGAQARRRIGELREARAQARHASEEARQAAAQAEKASAERDAIQGRLAQARAARARAGQGKPRDGRAPAAKAPAPPSATPAAPDPAPGNTATLPAADAGRGASGGSGGASAPRRSGPGNGMRDRFRHMFGN